MKLPHKSLERTLLATGHGVIVGVDEVGMGCLAGPVVVCAAAFPASFYRKRWPQLANLRDSKMLQAHQRATFAERLAVHPKIRHVIVSVQPATIDRLNIYQAARLGMRRAIARLMRENPGNPVVLVDGPHPIAGIPWPQRAIVKGDRKVFAIAAASILAKVHRDALMGRLAKRYPGYGLEIHKGYATARHRAALAAVGPSPMHRRSFKLT